MVSLARSPHASADRELIVVVWTRNRSLREMLSLLLSRRQLRSRAFDTFDQLAAHVEPYRTRSDLTGLVVMVGPDVTQHHVKQLDAMFESIEYPAALVVFEDAMGDMEQPDWSVARVRPSLHAAVPPRMLDILRVVDELLAAAGARNSHFVAEPMNSVQ